MTETEKLTAELAQVESAISAAYTGSEYEISAGKSGRRLKRQSLDVLLRRKSEIELSLARLGGIGARGVRHGVPV